MLHAMFTMVFLTFVLGLLALQARIAGVRSGRIKSEDFRLMDAAQFPEAVVRTTRCFGNAFEVPVLFYAVCTLYLALGIESLAGFLFAWLFVFARYVQAYIHLTYNNVLHRMVAFLTGFLCVLVLWVDLLIQAA